MWFLRVQAAQGKASKGIRKSQVATVRKSPLHLPRPLRPRIHASSRQVVKSSSRQVVDSRHCKVFHFKRTSKSSLNRSLETCALHRVSLVLSVPSSTASIKTANIGHGSLTRFFLFCCHYSYIPMCTTIYQRPLVRVPPLQSLNYCLDRVFGLS